MEDWIANIFILEYIVLYCIWWYRAVQAGEFDWTLLEQLGLQEKWNEAKKGR